MRIAVFGNRYQEAHIEELSTLFDLMSRHNVWVEMEESFYNYLCSVLTSPPEVNDLIKGDDFNAAIALSIGGDGHVSAHGAACRGKGDTYPRHQHGSSRLSCRCHGQ